MVGRALDRKLLRDLWRLRAQVASIAFVIASGIALLVMSLSAVEALRESADAYYERCRFGNVFASVKRAPLYLQRRIEEIPGVQSVQLRIGAQAVLDLEGFAEPLMGRLVSVPEGEQPILNRLVLRSGRFVAAGRTNEVVVNESFAQAHGLQPGDSISAVINDRKRELRIVGTAMSPEFIYVLPPFALVPDKARFGILWMGRKALEAAYGQEGSFNDLSLTVLRDADTRPIIRQLDALLEPYGSTGAIDRRDHLSAWFVTNELKQNEATARILPTIFLLVAAFLTNAVLSRLIATERSEIGLLKAFGYSSAQVGAHYAKLVVAIVLLGIALGWVLGAVLGRISTGLYAENLNFALLIYRPGPSSFLIGALVSLAVALGATFRAVRGAALLPPIVAMRPPAPPVFRRRRGGGGRLRSWIDEPTRILIRQILRWPRRSAVTALSFAGAVGLMILSLQFTDAIDALAATHFGEALREDLALGFVDPKSTTVLSDVERLPGVLAAEPMRFVAADLSSGYRTHRGAVIGVGADSRMTRIFDVERGPLPVPPSGLVLSESLADKLGVRVGDDVWVRVLEGERLLRSVQVANVFGSYIGTAAYMDIVALNRMLGDRPMVEYVNALIDEDRLPALMARLKNLPAVSTVALKHVAVASFHEIVAASLMVFVGFFSAFSFALGFGVTYNAQRIALSERGRELATLRVLGFSRHDALYILLGETLLLVCVALPIGCVVGWVLTAIFVNASGFQTEMMRLPLEIQASTYGLSVLFLLLASLVSGAAMKRQVDHLDLISVLKTRE
ncbi:MAG: FtsX-like permease family protein [Myxococcota bacterium]|nr:FtsX-like permease family protein [Myxococcota bacterium]